MWKALRWKALSSLVGCHEAVGGVGYTALATVCGRKDQDEMLRTWQALGHPRALESMLRRAGMTANVEGEHR